MTTIVLLSVAQTVVDTSICPGEWVQVGSATYDLPGTYTDTLLADNGCDSIVTLTMTFLGVPRVAINRSICPGGSVTVGSSTYTLEGTYVDTLVAGNGCDSIVTATITVLSVLMKDLDTAICPGGPVVLIRGRAFRNQDISGHPRRQI